MEFSKSRGRIYMFTHGSRSFGIVEVLPRILMCLSMRQDKQMNSLHNDKGTQVKDYDESLFVCSSLIWIGCSSHAPKA